MNDEMPDSKRRLVKSEQLLRRQNTIAKQAVKKLLQPDKSATKVPLTFSCECSDLRCNEQISLSIAEYEKLHTRKDRFVVHKGHANPKVETVIENKPEFTIVEKFALSPSSGS